MSTTAHDDDLVLLRQYRQFGDQRAFTQLVDRHLQSVYGTAYRDLRNVHDAEDICQKVFTKLAQKGRYVRIRSVSGWLFAITRQEVCDMKRSEGRRRARETVAAEDPTLAHGESPAAFDGEPNPVVQEAFNLLKEPEQQALFLRFHDELDFKQMGSALGVSQRAAQKRLYRAMDRLRTLLSKRGITASSIVIVGSLFAAPDLAPASELGVRISQQALFDAAATPLPSELSIWLAQTPVWVVGAALLVTGGVVTATVSSQNRQEKTSQGVTMAAAGPESILTERRRVTSSSIAIDDLEAIYQLPQTARAAALERLENHLESKGDPLYLDDLFKRWADLDAPRGAQALFTLIGRYHENSERDALLRQVLAIPLEAWLAENREPLFQWMRELPRSQAESLTFNAFMRVLCSDDPQRAFAMLADRGASDDQPYQILADALAARGAGFTCDFLHALPSSETNAVTSTLNKDVELKDRALDPRTRLFAATIPQLFAHSPQEVADWVTNLPDSREANTFTSAFVQQWAAIQPNEAAAWIEELSAPARETNAPALLTQWSRHDFEAATQWAFQEGQLGNPYQAIKPAFTELLVADEWKRPNAIRWLEAHVSEPGSAPLFGIASETLGSEDALAWAIPLAHGDSRQNALDHAFFGLGLTDAASGAQRLETIEPIAARQAAALALAEGMFIGQGRSSVARLQEKAEAKGQTLLALAAHEARVGILAALNPKLIADDVFDLPSGASKDHLLTTLLDRTYRRSSDHAVQARQWAAKFQHPGLRRDWEVRIDQTLADAPWQNTASLPDRLKSGFKTQSLAEFRERLELLSKIPPLRSP